VLECLDDAALRRWCEAGLAALRRHQREIEELNVSPVPDGTPGWYKEWPLWDCRQLDAVDVDAFGAIVAERQAWIAASVSKRDAAAYLGWRRDEFPASRSSRASVATRRCEESPRCRARAERLRERHCPHGIHQAQSHDRSTNSR
jgi:hypothetical protein